MKGKWGSSVEERRQKSEGLFFARVVGVGSIPTPTIMAKTLEELYSIPTDPEPEIQHKCLICGKDLPGDGNFCPEPCKGREPEEGEIF